VSAVVIMRGGLGDIVLVQRAIADLKRRLGDRELCVVTEPKYADLFMCAGAVDKLILVSGPREAKRLKQRLRSDGVVVYDLDHPFSGQRERRDRLHILERLDELLATSAAHLPPMLEVPPVSLGGGHAVLTWASSAVPKLPADREAIWERFRRASEAAGLQPVCIGLPADGVPASDRFEGSLLQLCGAVRGAALYFGCDTGFSHVASTAQVPSVICHIGYPIARCGVKNPNADILYYGDSASVNTEEVCAQIDAAAGRL